MRCEWSDFIFVSDGKPIWRVKIVKTFENRNFFLSPNWSSILPDLNLIKNISNLLNVGCKRTNQTSTIAEAKQAILEEWDNEK